MDARNTLQWIVNVVIILGGLGLSCPVYAGLVHIYGGDFDLPIPANPDDTKGWMPDAVINITDHITISDLDVAITLTHTNVFDLQIFLQNPAGTSLCLNMYDFDEFFVGANYEQTIFDDEAAVPIEHAQAPFTGRFRPRTPTLLQVFDGQDSFGSWRLRIYDAWYADTGTLDTFELIITTPAPEPATAILLILGAGLINLFRPRRTSSFSI